jgi:hypothetical protein
VIVKFLTLSIDDLCQLGIMTRADRENNKLEEVVIINVNANIASPVHMRILYSLKSRIEEERPYRVDLSILHFIIN